MAQTWQVGPNILRCEACGGYIRVSLKGVLVHRCDTRMLQLNAALRLAAAESRRQGKAS